MSINKIQFQRGMSLLDFIDCYGTEPQCIAALFQRRWPSGFCCPIPGHPSNLGWRKPGQPDRAEAK